METPLGRGELPVGLQVLYWDSSTGVELGAGVLPATLLMVKLTACSWTRIAPGAIPVGVRWLSVNRPFAEREQKVLPAAVRVRLEENDEFEW
jgi:hypothetical protein